jgi:hypothetical protein
MEWLVLSSRVESGRLGCIQRNKKQALARCISTQEPESGVLVPVTVTLDIGTERGRRLITTVP